MPRIPDLVTDEPVATGWLRTELYGDRDKSSALIQQARAQLGAMRTMYGVNARIAAGEGGGFYHAMHTLPDGSTIQTITNDGHDTIRIWTTPDVSGGKGKRITEIKISEMRICGTVEDADYNWQAVLWRGLDEVISLGALTAGGQSQGIDISDDGTTVVGAADSDSGDSHAFRWTEDAGMVDLGLMPGMAGGFSTAMSVSADGSVICGIGSKDQFGAVGPWRWTQAGGMVALPDTADGLGSPNLDDSIAVSPNGRYIAGLVSTPLVDYNNIQGALWEVDPDTGAVSGPTLIAHPGTTSDLPTNNNTPQTTADYSFPTGVTDDGVVTGYTTHVETIERHITYTEWNYPDFQPAVRTETRTAIVPDVLNTVFIWDSVKDVYQIVADGYATAQADDTGVIVGNRRRADLIVSTSSGVYNDGHGSHWQTDEEIYGDDTWAGWTWTPAPVNAQASLGDNTRASDISEDGDAIVGCTVDSTNTPQQPQLWLGNGDNYELPLTDGGVTGWASAVGFATVLDTSDTEDE